MRSPLHRIVGVAPLLAVATPLGAQPVDDRGAPPLVVLVADDAGRPLADASLLEGDGDVLARTDASGVARLRRSAGATTTLRLRAVGHAPLDRVVAVDRDTVRLVLRALPLALDQVVVTAARREQRLADAVVTTEVVSRGDIERTGASDLASVLVEQTGVQLQGGHPSGAGLMLQGIGAERVLVLLDGQPLVGRIAGNFDLSRLPTAMIERVEVVKGPQSTLYGSEAMGGVINVVTRATPELGWRGGASVTGGTEGRRDLAASAGAARGAWSASADLGMRQVHRAPGRAGTAGALADRADGAAKLRWSDGADRWVEASALVLDERQRWSSAGLYDFADNRQLGARLTASVGVADGHRLTPTLHLSEFDHLARTSRTAQPVAGTGDRQVQRLVEGELLYAGRLRGAAIDAGVELRQESISSSDGRILAEDGRAGDRTLRAVEPFAQVELGGDRWSVVPGARLTWNEQWGTNLAPRLSARWRAGDALTLRLSAGRGFRAPDFKELYLRFTNDGAGYVVSGNPTLRPEHSDNVTAGAEWSDRRGYARLQLFHNRLRDFIETRPVVSTDALARYEYRNVEQGLTQGAELEGGVLVGPAHVEAGWAWLRAEDRATGLALLGRPAHSARLSLAGPLPLAVRGSLAGTWTAATPIERAPDGAVSAERASFLRFDARLARRLPQGLELVVGVDNLLDRRPAFWEGAVARQLYTALSWSAAR